MNIETLALALITSAPLVCEIISQIISYIKTLTLFKRYKEDTDFKFEKISKIYDNIAILKAKIESLEKYIQDKERNKK